MNNSQAKIAAAIARLRKNAPWFGKLKYYEAAIGHYMGFWHAAEDRAGNFQDRINGMARDVRTLSTKLNEAQLEIAELERSQTTVDETIILQRDLLAWLGEQLKTGQRDMPAFGSDGKWHVLQHDGSLQSFHEDSFPAAVIFARTISTLPVSRTSQPL